MWLESQTFRGPLPTLLEPLQINLFGELFPEPPVKDKAASETLFGYGDNIWKSAAQNSTHKKQECASALALLGPGQLGPWAPGPILDPRAETHMLEPVHK